MQPVRVYIAAPWTHRADAKLARIRLVEEGFEVTSRWLDVVEATENIEAAKQEEALNDVQDVFDSDALILLNLSNSRGKETEFGLAIAWQRPVIIVGERSQIFHHLPIPRVDTIDEAIAQLNEWTASYAKARAEYVTKEQGE